MGTASLLQGFQAPASVLGSLEGPRPQGFAGSSLWKWAGFPGQPDGTQVWGPRCLHSSAVLPPPKEEILPIKPFYYRFSSTDKTAPPASHQNRWEENQALDLKGFNGILSSPPNYSVTSILNVWFISSKMISTLLINQPYLTTSMPQVV